MTTLHQILSGPEQSRLLFIFREHGVQHRGESFATEVGECETRFLGGGLGGVQAEGRRRADHHFSM